MKLLLFVSLFLVINSVSAESASDDLVCIHAGGSEAAPQCFPSSEFVSPRDRRVLEEMRNSKVTDVKNATGLHARETTLLMTLESGLIMKCKNEKLVKYGMEILGNEVHAFYFDRVLHIGSVPPASVVDFSGRRWKGVKKNKRMKRWRRGDVLQCSEWVEDLEPAIIPDVFLNSKEKLTRENVAQEDIATVENWSQTMAFDFLAGVNDRWPPSLSGGEGFRAKGNRKPGKTAYNHCNRKSEQNGPECAVYNLFTHPNSGHLVSVDNGGFFYDKAGSLEQLDYVLQDTCVFPTQFVERIKDLGSKHKGTIRALTALETKHDPNMQVMQWNRQGELEARVFSLIKHFEECQY